MPDRSRVGARVVQLLTMVGGLTMGVAIGVLLGRRSTPMLTIPETAVAMRGAMSSSQIAEEIAAVPGATPRDRLALAMRLLEWRRAGADSVTRRAAALGYVMAERQVDSLEQAQALPYVSPVVRAAMRDALYSGVTVADLQTARGQDPYAYAQDVDRLATMRRRDAMLRLRAVLVVPTPP